jgi:hypothetical protein
MRMMVSRALHDPRLRRRLMLIVHGWLVGMVTEVGYDVRESRLSAACL